MAETYTHAEVEELLGVYALDALDGAEAAEVEAHLATCPRCAAEVLEHREVAALLAHSGSPAPDGLWGRISDSLSVPPPVIDFDRASLARADIDSRPTGRRGWAVRAGALGLVAAAVLIGILGVRVRDLDRQIDQIDATDLAVKQALADPGADVVKLTSADGTVGGKVVISSAGPDFLVASDLPALADDRTYQLWGVVEGNVISLGVLGNQPDVVSFETSGRVSTFALTDEVAGGVVVSTQAPVATATLDS